METIDKAAHSAHEAVDKLANANNQAAEALSEKGERLRFAEQKTMENCRSYVRDNPIISLGIAAGFLLSRVISSR